MKVFYHDDMDGKLAARIAYLYARDRDDALTNYEFYAMRYGMKFPFADIVSGEVVYILDFSLEPCDLEKLLDMAEVVWIDHHKTAIERAADHFGDSMSDIDGLRKSGDGAGCLLTWRYLRGDEQPPYVVRLVSDRDEWKYEFGDNTRYMHCWLLSKETDPKSGAWVTAWNFHKECIREGAYMYAYKTSMDRDLVSRRAFDCTLSVPGAEYMCVAVNGSVNSEPFEVMYPDYDIWIVFYYDPNGWWTVSLYSNKDDIDVSEIASRYEYRGKRGGGHKGAAGFQCGSFPFRFVYNTGKLMSLYDHNESLVGIRLINPKAR